MNPYRAAHRLRIYDTLTTAILWAASNGELQGFSNSLGDRAQAYGMEVSTEKTEIMTSSTYNIDVKILA